MPGKQQMYALTCDYQWWENTFYKLDVVDTDGAMIILTRWGKVTVRNYFPATIHPAKLQVNFESEPDQSARDSSGRLHGSFCSTVQTFFN